MSPDEARTRALERLVRLDCPVEEAIEALGPFGWDGASEVVAMSAADLLRTLARRRSRDLSDDDVVRWAEAIAAREDVGFEDGDDGPVRGAVVELSSPQLFGPTDEVLERWSRLIGRRGSFDAWLDAYEVVWRDPPALQDLACPTCRARDLRLRFIAFTPGSRSVMPAFWCETCAFGMPPARALLPEWAEAVPAGEAAVTNYWIVADDATSP